MENLSKELRIGNYVYAQSGKLVVNRDSIYKVENVNMQSARKYEPIPLTEEWLLKFGFQDGEWKSKTSSNCLCHVNGTLHISDARDVDYSFESPCKYVHQLQNLYFALTGEELQLK